MIQVVALLRILLLFFSWTGTIHSFHVVGVSPFPRRSLSSGHNAAGSNNNEGPVNKDSFVTAYGFLQQKVGVTGSSGVFDDYMIGKVMVELDLVPEPGLELAEAANGMTLVSGVSGNAKNVGIQVGDTIIQVTGGLMSVSTKELPLQDTGSYLMQAAENAAQCGTSLVKLTLNRLIKIRFADS